MASAGTNARSNGGRGISWREKETLDLLALWGEEWVQEALSSCHRNIDVFEKIVRQMHTLGHKRSAMECRSKTKAMRQEYRRLVAHNGRTGNSPATCPFYKQLDKILRDDASVRPKRIARSLKITFVKASRNATAQPAPAAPAPGSEELFSHDLAMINPDHLRCSMPIHHLETPGGDQEDGVGQEASPNLDKTALSTQIDDEILAQHQGLLGEGFMDDPGNGMGTQRTEEQGDAEEENQPMPLVELSAETRLEICRNRQKHVAVLRDIGERMLEQGQADQAESIGLMQTLMARGEERFRALMEEGEWDRNMFWETMATNSNAIMAAVDA